MLYAAGMICATESDRKSYPALFLQVTDLYDPREQWASYLINALKAKELQFKDVNYIVRGPEVIIVDEFTGRTMPGRRWGDGLHQVCHASSLFRLTCLGILMLARVNYLAAC